MYMLQTPDFICLLTPQQTFGTSTQGFCLSATLKIPIVPAAEQVQILTGVARKNKQ